MKRIGGEDEKEAANYRGVSNVCVFSITIFENTIHSGWQSQTKHLFRSLFFLYRYKFRLQCKNYIATIAANNKEQYPNAGKSYVNRQSAT